MKNGKSRIGQNVRDVKTFCPIRDLHPGVDEQYLFCLRHRSFLGWVMTGSFGRLGFERWNDDSL